MTDKASKARYVVRQAQTRNHHCHWPGCEKQCPPAMWGCLRHWKLLPKILRDKIWLTFEPGQEKNYTPSRAYVRVAQEVQSWIHAEYHGL